jgi:signal transduction histidine kinase/ligand-binding sensor domain-containing protein
MRVNRPFAPTALLLVLSATLLWPRSALAVDPNRALTQYVHRIWQVPQGLPQATIYAILQDAQGYLWLGTQAGLVRFDGVRFTTIDEPAVKDAWVQSLAQDRRGTVWIGTRDAGLFRIRDGVVSNASRNRGLAEDVRILLVDRDGSVWVTILNGAAVARLTADKLASYGARQGLPTRDIAAACQAEDGTIWIGGGTSDLSIWNGAGFARYRLSSVAPSASVQTMLRTSDGSIWVGTSDGLVQVRGGRERRFTVADGLADNSVLALAESREGGVWVGTKNGFSRVRPGEIESFGTQGSFWVGTKHGLNQFLDGRTIPYTTKEGLPSNEAGPLLQGPAANVWVGTLDAGLGRYDGRRFTLVSARNGLPSNTIRALARNAEGDVWIGTDAGLARVRNGRVERAYTTAQGLPANAIRALFFDRGGTLWVGTSSGATTIDRGVIVRPPAAGPPARDAVAALAEDRAGQIIAAVQGGGVYALTGNHWTELQARGVPIRDVDALYEDPGGLLWMGTLGNGLWLIDRSRVVSYSMRDGLFDDEIYGMVADTADRLWMACSKGIFSVDRGDLVKFAAGSIRHVTSTPYSPTDALRTIECRSGVQPAVWRMQDGRLWFSTIRGVIVIDPNHLERKLPAPPVVVEDVTVNGQRERPGEVRGLPAGANNLEFVYTALSFVAPTRIAFRYVLEGFDRDWNSAGTRREAFYTNLPPGSFRFRVMACNVDGTCAEAAHDIAFTIAPRLYERLWFLPACVALLALGVWLAYRLRVRRLRAGFAIVLAERNRIARELHDTLIQGFSGITMQLQALVGRVPGSREHADLEEIIRDAGWCLREARRSLAGLRSAQGAGSGLAAAVEQTARQQTGGKDVRLKLKVDEQIPELPANVGYNLLRIEQEAIANALKHSGALTVEVSLRGGAGGVELSIADDGEGFESDEATLVQLGHYGLVGMRERAGEIGAELVVTSGRGKGTTITLRIPLPETAPVAERVSGE